MLADFVGEWNQFEPFESGSKGDDLLESSWFSGEPKG